MSTQPTLTFAGLLTDSFGAAIAGLKRFSESFDAVIEASRRFNVAWDYHRYYSRRELQAVRRYRRAGVPYGRNTRGKKRWLREMRQYQRSTQTRGL